MNRQQIKKRVEDKIDFNRDGRVNRADLETDEGKKLARTALLIVAIVAVGTIIYFTKG